MTTVYIAHDADDEVLYVGHTSLTVSLRMALHRSTSDWAATTARIETIEFDDAGEARECERRLILDFEPLHNIQGNPRHQPSHFAGIFGWPESGAA